MINPTYFTILSMFIAWHIKAVKFGFRTCTSAVDPDGESKDSFTMTYQWSQAVYTCQVTLSSGYGEEASCDTINITPDNCAPDYGLQISADDAPNTGSNSIDDVCVSSIIVNGEEIDVLPQRIGDHAASGGPNPEANEYANYRYYDLGDNAPDGFPASLAGSGGEVVTDPAPICADPPPVTWTGDDTKFDHTLFNSKKFYQCNDGEIIGGFQKNPSGQNLQYLEDMRCVKPDISTTLTFEPVADNCYDLDIRGPFDSAYTATCNQGGYEGYFVNGIYSTAADNGLGYWETLKCCKYADNNVIIIDDDDSEYDWNSCFDAPDAINNNPTSDRYWCVVPNTLFITGFKRGGTATTDGVQFLEEAQYRQIYLTATGGNQCQLADVASFDWDTLTEEGLDAAGVEFNQLTDVTEFYVDESDLSLNIKVEVPYLGRATADDMEDPLFGVTYVLDFEDYDAHQDAIYEPGTCQNRQSSSYDNKDFVDDFWDYSYNPVTDIGSNGYLAYPPATPAVGEWEVEMDGTAPCGKVIYTGKFTWSELRGCTSFGGTESYTDIIHDEKWLNLTGSLYINLVSPFWYNKDYEFYRVYQLLSQPFIIAVSKVVNVLGSTGINVMTMSVIAVYKQDEGPDNELTRGGTNKKDIFADFRLILLTECSDYMTLENPDTIGVTFDGSAFSNTQVSDDDFSVLADSENNGCLNNKGFICSQLWQIDATNIACTDEKGRDFSGNYALTFDPVCRDDIDTELSDYCDTFLNNHPQLTNDRIALSTDLVWKDEICTPEIFTVQFAASMTFYADDGAFATAIEDSHLYQVGEDTIYVQVDTTFPSDTLSVFDTQLIQVHICTFNPLKAPIAGSTGPTTADLANFGCFISDETVRDIEYDEYFYQIYEANPTDTSTPIRAEFDFKDSYNDYIETTSNAVRFSFTVPNEVARDTLYVMAEIEVTLTEDLPRRRVLLSSSTSDPTANQLQHFVQPIGINHGQEIINHKQPQQEPKYNEPNNNYNPPEQYYPPQQPYQPVTNPNPSYTINLSSPWIIALGGLLGLILTFNIMFMTYRNCCDSNGSYSGRVSFMRRRGNKGKYSKVNVESEFDSEAQMIGNADDESQ